MEAELFAQKKVLLPAPTVSSIGRFEAADKGNPIFLDE